ncbi:MAG: hypothetical protein ABSG49_07705 [Methanoregula sp.]|jgi:hypothetical protein|uniref:hypothetical protein n=1 Tax=Methanoregula sp. TaxID=2052170 RepID=UPI003C2A937D
MQYKITVPVIILLCIVIVFAGCTGTQSSSGTATSVSSSGSASAGDNLITSPTDSIPDNNAVSVTVQEKEYDGKIHVAFDGGKGQSLVSSIDVTLYRSDGQIMTTKIGTNKGDEVILEGTKNPDKPDRVVVYVSEMNGQTYKVDDALRPYRQH